MTVWSPSGSPSRSGMPKMTFIREPYPQPRSRWISRKTAATLAYERTRTHRAAKLRTFWGNALALALIFGSLILTSCTIMGRG